MRHSSWLITRYLIKDDGKTPYERLQGRTYKGELAEFGEVVHWKNPVSEASCMAGGAFEFGWASHSAVVQINLEDS